MAEHGRPREPRALDGERWVLEPRLGAERTVTDDRVGEVTVKTLAEQRAVGPSTGRRARWPRRRTCRRRRSVSAWSVATLARQQSPRLRLVSLTAPAHPD